MTPRVQNGFLFSRLVSGESRVGYEIRIPYQKYTESTHLWYSDSRVLREVVVYQIK